VDFLVEEGNELGVIGPEASINTSVLSLVVQKVTPLARFLDIVRREGRAEVERKRVSHSNK
jgi:hypothetical protein